MIHRNTPAEVQMAKGFERPGERKRGFGMAYPDHPDAVTMQKLGEVVSDLFMATEENDRTRLWSSASRLLGKLRSADKQRVSKVLLEKRVGALSKLVTDLEAAMRGPVKGQPAGAADVVGAGTAPPAASSPPHPASAESQAPEAAGSVPTPPSAASPAHAGPDAETLKHAMKAFRKRLKLTRLDEESKLGNRAMTGGRQSAIVAIIPPREYPVSVWQELARQGKLKPSSGGFYQLAEGV
jgi:hypothetical protein